MGNMIPTSSPGYYDRLSAHVFSAFSKNLRAVCCNCANSLTEEKNNAAIKISKRPEIRWKRIQMAVVHICAKVFVGNLSGETRAYKWRSAHVYVYNTFSTTM